jgi:hypothetical protein
MSSWLLQALFIVAALLAAGSTAEARRTGQFGASGRLGSTCTRCHTGNAQRPTVDVALRPINPALPSPFSAGFVPGARYTVTITVTGGPAVVFGFNSDASAGTGIRTDTARTQQRVAGSTEFTHTSLGIGNNSWSYDWVAPPSSDAVTFWVAVNSGNGNTRDTGDGITATSFVLSPIAQEVLCRLGGVNAALGIDGVAEVLSINGSFGDDFRVVTLPTRGPFSMEIAAYPGAPSRIPYVVYAILRENTANDVTPHPFGLGSACFPTPLSGGNALCVVNTVGREGTLGVPLFPDTPLGPGQILAQPSIRQRFAGVVATVQGAVPDANSLNGQGAFTNAVVIRIQ